MLSLQVEKLQSDHQVMVKIITSPNEASSPEAIELLERLRQQTGKDMPVPGSKAAKGAARPRGRGGNQPAVKPAPVRPPPQPRAKPAAAQRKPPPPRFPPAFPYPSPYHPYHPAAFAGLHRPMPYPPHPYGPWMPPGAASMMRRMPTSEGEEEEEEEEEEAYGVLERPQRSAPVPQGSMQRKGKMPHPPPWGAGYPPWMPPPPGGDGMPHSYRHPYPPHLSPHSEGKPKAPRKSPPKQKEQRHAPEADAARQQTGALSGRVDAYPQYHPPSHQLPYDHSLPLPSPFSNQQELVLQSMGSFPGFDDERADSDHEMAPGPSTAAASGGRTLPPQALQSPPSQQQRARRASQGLLSSPTAGAAGVPATANVMSSPSSLMLHPGGMSSRLPSLQLPGGGMSSRMSIPVQQLIRLLRQVASGRLGDADMLDAPRPTSPQQQQNHQGGGPRLPSQQQGHAQASPNQPLNLQLSADGSCVHPAPMASPPAPVADHPAVGRRMDASLSGTTPFSNAYFASAAANGLHITGISPASTMTKAQVTQMSHAQQQQQQQQQGVAAFVTLTGPSRGGDKGPGGYSQCGSPCTANSDHGHHSQRSQPPQQVPHQYTQPQQPYPAQQQQPYQYQQPQPGRGDEAGAGDAPPPSRKRKSSKRSSSHAVPPLPWGYPPQGQGGMMPPQPHTFPPPEQHHQQYPGAAHPGYAPPLMPPPPPVARHAPPGPDPAYSHPAAAAAPPASPSQPRGRGHGAAAANNAYAPPPPRRHSDGSGVEGQSGLQGGAATSGNGSGGGPARQGGTWPGESMGN